jgi:crotonobetainyl-CoA:carnitine CoA-transferase CaiB-like acyl-CoA transferase
MATCEIRRLILPSKALGDAEFARSRIAAGLGSRRRFARSRRSKCSIDTCEVRRCRSLPAAIKYQQEVRMQQPLIDVRVLDISEFGFAPTAAAVLGDWGADVIKVEKPSGDPLRSHTQMIPGDGDFSVLIEHFNRNKRGLVLDISCDAGREVLDRLLDWADVLITNFLPKTLRKLGLTPEHVRAQHPKLIYARATGQGSKGPDVDTPGFDGATWWARGGVGHTLSPPQASARMRAALGDGPTGTFLAGGIAAALYERDRTGLGSIVETSLLQGAMWTLAPDLTSTALLGEEPPSEMRNSSFSALLGVYRTADERRLQLTMPNDRWWEPACRALGLEALLTDPRLSEPEGRARNSEELREVFASVIRTRDLADLESSLAAQGCVFAHFNSLSEVLADPQVAANGFMVAHPTHTTGRLVASPVQFGGEPVSIRRGAPRLGEHSVEVLTDAGLTAEEIQALLDAGVTQQTSS